MEGKLRKKQVHADQKNVFIRISGSSDKNGHWTWLEKCKQIKAPFLFLIVLLFFADTDISCTYYDLEGHYKVFVRPILIALYQASCYL